MHRLSKYFGSGRHLSVVVILDELDLLLKKKSSILYNFFEWTGWSTAKLIVVAIANTMDLPERFLPNRIASRMGSNRINFKPYTYPQLMAIISHRQSDWQNIFHPDALEYCARKVSAVSGDARRALSLAKRAVDWVKGNLHFSEGKLITIPLMEQAIQMTFAGNSVQVMGDLSTQQKILLLAIMMSARTSESSSVPFERACECHWQLLRNNNMPTVSFASLQIIFSQLENVRLASKQDVDMRSPVVASSVVKLCVPEEEVALALKHEVALQKHLQS
ncbi:hypothetical protein PSACC_03291 [Paramicrosporidium saccamoebae]|uniref:Origin recognition complex subunit 1 n=1 Tax=Paramicrosporidium saccamoebae TaxID=1246581 RepID=A0A2H9TGK7_9FUNG|nr:hypothetical protein PSACC_03291 [Paramicrosporidium saccamoebae]